MKPVRQRPIKRPAGTLFFSPNDPAMNRRATFDHSSGMTELKNETFAEISEGITEAISWPIRS
jgi:hypothetical protein